MLDITCDQLIYMLGIAYLFNIVYLI